MDDSSDDATSFFMTFIGLEETKKKTEDKLEADKDKQRRKAQQLADEAERLRQRNAEKLRQKAAWDNRVQSKHERDKQALEQEWKKPRFGVGGVTTYDGERADAFNQGMVGRIMNDD